MIDLELLVKPISVEDPCGPDLDSEGDLKYLNFFASAESLLPMSYFEVKDSGGNTKRFDPNSIDLNTQLETVKPLLARTRDLRLVVFLAKISILGRDLASFATCLEAIAILLDQHWTAVHPRGEDGDLSHRKHAIEAIDVLPTVIMPLQFHPLLNNRRYGWISYRNCLIARGEITPREDDTIIDAAALEQIFDSADINQLKATTATVVALATVVGRIRKIWSEKDDSATVLNLDRLSATVDGAAGLLGSVVKRRDPDAVPAVAEAEQGRDAGAAGSSPGGAYSEQRVTSMAAAAAALNAVANYFGRSEPSSPALLLVRQAQQMLGKSFVEALRILVPAHAETAAINIGKDRFFDLPIERMAGLLDGVPAPDPAVSENPAAYLVENRGQALGLLDQVGAYFRNVEPSSPVPFLIDRARELAQRDFLSLLRDVLPEGALKTPDNQS
jgi:type VI secretion system protein ImpA